MLIAYSARRATTGLSRAARRAGSQQARNATAVRVSRFRPSNHQPGGDNSVIMRPSTMLAAMIALALFTIMALDYPFSGDISIKPDVFRMVLSTLLNS